jgi:glucose-6-phosphate 1-dehydrogenase
VSVMADGHVATLRRELGGAAHPAHYLAIPPPLFGPVVEQLARSGCADGARVVVEKPFGQDLVSARDLNRILLGTFVERDIFRIDHYLGKRPVHNMLFFRFSNPVLEAIVRLKQPPTVFPTTAPRSNYFRFRIVPRQTIAFGVTAMDEADRMIGQRAELVASRQPGAEERAAYERVLGNALEGDATLFARMDYVGGLAHRRSGVDGEHAGVRLRARHVGARLRPAHHSAGRVGESRDRRRSVVL